MPLIGSTTFGTGTTVGLFVRDLELREVHLRGIRHEEWEERVDVFRGVVTREVAHEELRESSAERAVVGVASTVEDVRFPAAANEISKLEPILHKNRKRTHAYNQSYNTYPPSPARSHPQGSPSSYTHSKSRFATPASACSTPQSWQTALGPRTLGTRSSCTRPTGAPGSSPSPRRP